MPISRTSSSHLQHRATTPRGERPRAGPSRVEATHSGAAKWEAAPDHSYEAVFTTHGVRTGIRYDAAGQVLETRVVIGSFDLPDPVKKAVIRDLRRYHILETWRVDLPGNRPPQFIVESDNIREAVTIR